MGLIAFFLLSTVAPFSISMRLFRRGQCSLYCVLLAPVIGLSLSVLLLTALAIMSGEM
jgi:hypothetical protein